MKKGFEIIPILAIFCAFSLSGWALQSESKDGLLVNLSGTVKDATGAVLPGVLLTVQPPGLSTNSDNLGYFSFGGTPAGNLNVVASLPGFKKQEITVLTKPGQDSRLEIVLELESREYSVIVESTSPKLMSAAESIGVVTVMPSQVMALPSLGEKDIFRSLQLMPGISGSTESSSGLYVRGGTPDQNLVLFDGFTVHKVDHFFGIFSAFNAAAVDNMTILKGGFDARYGGRLSSVVDLTGRNGSSEGLHYSAGLSLLSYNLGADGPLGKKGTLLLAARRSFQSPFSARIRDNYTNTTPGPGGGGFQSTQPKSSFYDLNGRATYLLTPQDSLVLSLYYGKDNFDNSRSLNFPSFGSDQNQTLTGDISDISRWGNAAASFNWRRSWSRSFSSNWIIAVSRYFKSADRSTNVTSSNSSTGTDRDFENDSSEHNRVDDVTFRWTNSLVLSHKHYLEFGSEIIRNAVKYAYNFNDEMGVLDRPNVGNQQAFYLQDRYQPFRNFEITPGIRATRFSITRQTYVEPRLSMIFHVSGRLRIKAAGGSYHQFVSNLTRENPMEGDQDFWTLADGNIVRVSSSDHFIAGASYETAGFLLDIEGYHKELRNLSEFGQFRMRPREQMETMDFNTLFFAGSGKADGLELLGQKKFGANTGWITYTLGRVRHYFPGLSPSAYRASHDSTHEIKIVDSWHFKKFTFSGNWVYATGKPFTEPTGSDIISFQDGRSMEIPTFGDKNGARLPEYHRLDLSASWDFYRAEGAKAQLGVSVFNFYNRANVWRREYRFFGGDAMTTDTNYLGMTFSVFMNVDFNPVPEGVKAGPAWISSDAKRPEAGNEFEKPGKIYDFYGHVVSMDYDRIAVKTNLGTQEFVLKKTTIKGEPTYEEGAYVHIYYRNQTEGHVVTMVVRKVDKKWGQSP